MFLNSLRYLNLLINIQYLFKLVLVILILIYINLLIINLFYSIIFLHY